jgi:hypothetical protein
MYLERIFLDNLEKYITKNTHNEIVLFGKLPIK